MRRNPLRNSGCNYLVAAPSQFSWIADDLLRKVLGLDNLRLELTNGSSTIKNLVRQVPTQMRHLARMLVL